MSCKIVTQLLKKKNVTHACKCSYHKGSSRKYYTKHCYRYHDHELTEATESATV